MQTLEESCLHNLFHATKQSLIQHTDLNIDLILKIWVTKLLEESSQGKTNIDLEFKINGLDYQENVHYKNIYYLRKDLQALMLTFIKLNHLNRQESCFIEKNTLLSIKNNGLNGIDDNGIYSLKTTVQLLKEN